MRSTTCNICHRPLKNPISIARGMGSTCARKVRADQYKLKSPSLFSMPDFIWGYDGNVIWLKDRNLGGRSLTNGMEDVLKYLHDDIGLNPENLNIIYQDSEGMWDHVKATKKWNTWHIHYLPIQVQDYTKAKQILKHKYLKQ